MIGKQWFYKKCFLFVPRPPACRVDLNAASVGVLRFTWQFYQNVIFLSPFDYALANSDSGQVVGNTFACSLFWQDQCVLYIEDRLMVIRFSRKPNCVTNIRAKNIYIPPCQHLGTCSISKSKCFLRVKNLFITKSNHGLFYGSFVS